MRVRSDAAAGTDPSQEFFSDGMTEALISRLAQVSDLRVTSRTSAMQFKGTSAPVPDIGRQLGVDAVVEGSVQRDGRRVRVTVQLIHAASDSHLWAKDGTTEDVLDLQRRIALAIAGDISSKIAPVAPTGGPKRRLSVEAVDAYLRGRYLFFKTDYASRQRAIAELRKAVELEPAYADAQAILALALAQSGFANEALQLARKAVALDDNPAEAHAALAAASFELWDWENTQREFERALALYPNKRGRLRQLRAGALGLGTPRRSGRVSGPVRVAESGVGGAPYQLRDRPDQRAPLCGGRASREAGAGPRTGERCRADGAGPGVRVDGPA